MEWYIAGHGWRISHFPHFVVADIIFIYSVKYYALLCGDKDDKDGVSGLIWISRLLYLKLLCSDHLTIGKYVDNETTNVQVMAYMRNKSSTLISTTITPEVWNLCYLMRLPAPSMLF